jgi:hypothetical protein
MEMKTELIIGKEIYFLLKNYFSLCHFLCYKFVI